MTDSDALLVFLALATTLNFALLARLWRRMDRGQDGAFEWMFPVGLAIETFTGVSRNRELVEIGPAGQKALVCIFLSEHCPKCRAAAPAVVDAAVLTQRHGVALWVATAEHLSAASLGQNVAFEDFFLDLPSITYAMLNPRRASPAYLFVGSDMVVQASGFIGDEDWQSFLTQIGEPP